MQSGVNDHACADAVVAPIRVAPSNIKTKEDTSAGPEIGGLMLLVTVPLAAPQGSVTNDKKTGNKMAVENIVTAVLMMEFKGLN